MCCYTPDSSAFTPVCNTLCRLDGISNEEMTDSLLAWSKDSCRKMGFCKVDSTVRVVINASHLLLKDESSISEAVATSSSDDDDSDDGDDDGPLFVDDDFDEDILTGTSCPLP